ncbi:hypothetical protein OPFAMLBM_00319 [Aeromonas phage avDM12-TAAL]|nr:hypothetical protein OPFAMLBM_00319 [Aeromonas phage avDM12-TAAL]
MRKQVEKTRDLDGNLIYRNERYANEDNPWDHWQQMPHYEPKDIIDAYAEIEFEFDNNDDVAEFSKLADLPLSDKTKSIWWPKKGPDDYSVIRYVSDYTDLNQPKYPIYIVSKSRWEKRLTSDSLVRMKVKHYIVVEESQFEEYNSRVDHEYVTVIILDQKYLDEYDTFDNLGNTRSKGPGAARNFAWEHSMKMGFKRHWVMDDNQQHFFRLDGNKRIIVNSGAIFRAMEDHVDRYENVYIAGPHYRFFAVPKESLPPFVQNCRIYSTLLILNDIPYRWRGRYNEDTDLSLRVLKDGHCTIQYNAFLTGKLVTQAMAGGNTEAFYSKEGTLPKSQMIVDMHPDVARLQWMNGRWHHWVDYAPYRSNRLKLKNVIPEGCNEYGMMLTSIKASEQDANDEEE